jgi:calcium binding protein 39
MNLLRETHKAIQFEAFHGQDYIILKMDTTAYLYIFLHAVFKIFVANPRKSKQVLEILLRNKDKLIKFLDKFQNEKGLSI